MVRAFAVRPRADLQAAPACAAPLCAQRAFAPQVQRLEAAPVPIPQSRPGGPASHFSILPSGGEAVALVQRTVDEDLDEGWGSIGAAQGYEGQVVGQLDPYTRIIKQLGDSGDGHYEEAGTRMASGFKQWSANFYNKSQAYLYEAQKAKDKTDVRGRGRNSFGILGVDTDEEADLEVYTETLQDRGGRIVTTGESNTAVEIKASTSPNYDSLDKLVMGGVGQLKKRQDTGRFSNLQLEVHNDSSNNSWPVTAHTLATTYGGNIGAIPPLDWANRLATRMGSMKATKGATLPLKVTVEHAGTKYAEANV